MLASIIFVENLMNILPITTCINLTHDTKFSFNIRKLSKL